MLFYLLVKIDGVTTTKRVNTKSHKTNSFKVDVITNVNVVRDESLTIIHRNTQR